MSRNNKVQPTTAGGGEQKYQPRQRIGETLRPSESDWSRSTQGRPATHVQFSVRAEQEVFERFKALAGKDPVTKAKRSYGDVLELLLDAYDRETEGK